MGRRFTVRRLSSTVALTLALIVNPIARADDAPRMYQPPAPGEVVGYPNWVLTPDGKAKLDATLERQFSELVSLRAEKQSLQADLRKMESKPALTPLGVVLLVGAGLVVGGVTVGLLVR